MAKTYNTFTNVATGDVLTATNFNNLLTNTANYRVPPMCRVYNTGNISPYSSLSAITWDNENFDTDGMHSTSTNTNRITVTTAGIYLFVLRVNVTATTFSGWPNLRKNGTSVMIGPQTDASDGGNFHMQASLVIEMAVNDYIDAAVGIGGSTGTVAINGGTSNNGSWLAATWLGQVS
jgi:hypothetical protein